MTGTGLKAKEKQAFPNRLSSPCSRKLFPKAWNMRISPPQCKFTAFLTSQQASTCSLAPLDACHIAPTTFHISLSLLLKLAKWHQAVPDGEQSWKSEVPPALSVLFREVQSWFNREISRLSRCAYYPYMQQKEGTDLSIWW